MRKIEAYSYGCLMAMMPEPLAQRLRDYSAEIPDEAIYDDGSGEHGREKAPHVTVKYGIHTEDGVEVSRALVGERVGPTAILGKMTAFENEDYDVLKIDIHSPDLHRLNGLVADSLQVTDSYPVYKPHMTVAYLRKGSGWQQYASNEFEGTVVKFPELLFMSASDIETVIPVERYDLMVARVAARVEVDKLAGRLVKRLKAEDRALSLTDNMIYRFVRFDNGKEFFMAERDGTYYLMEYNASLSLSYGAKAKGSKNSVSRRMDLMIENIEKGVGEYDHGASIETESLDDKGRKHFQVFLVPVFGNTLDWNKNTPEVGDDEAGEQYDFDKLLYQQLERWRGGRSNLNLTRHRYWPKFHAMVVEAVKKKYGANITVYRGIWGDQAKDALGGKPIDIHKFNSWSLSKEYAHQFVSGRKIHGVQAYWLAISKDYKAEDVVFAPVRLPDYAPDPDVLDKWLQEEEEVVIEDQSGILKNYRMYKKSKKKMASQACRNVIMTGPPGSGKSTLLNRFRGIARIVKEVARDVIKERDDKGWGRGNIQSEIYSRSLREVEDALGSEDDWIVFDRTHIDCLAFGYVPETPPKTIEDAEVWVLRHHPEWYQQDDQRKETAEEAIEQGERLKKVYRDLGYSVQEIDAADPDTWPSWVKKRLENRKRI